MRGDFLVIFVSLLLALLVSVVMMLADGSAKGDEMPALMVPN